MGPIHPWRHLGLLFLRLSDSGDLCNENCFYFPIYIANGKNLLQIITYTCCLFFFNYCTPLSIIIFCYYHIVQAIVHHEKALRDQAKKMNVASLRSNADANAQSAEMRIAKVALMNISLWVGMWTPYAAIVLQGAVGNQEKITPIVTILPALICKCASIANPIIYAISHPKYRLVS